MNIFFLDKNPARAAEYHGDKHVVKMILETAQMLSTIVRLKRGYHGVFAVDEYSKKLGVTGEHGKKWKTYHKAMYGETGNYPKIYLMTHINHPCTRWAGKSLDNFKWLLSLGYFLGNEYTSRYGGSHKSVEVIKRCEPNIQRNNFGHLAPLTKADFPLDFLTKPPSVMPEEFIISDDPVINYRNYYAKEKAKFLTWKFSEKPKFIKYGKP